VCATSRSTLYHLAREGIPNAINRVSLTYLLTKQAGVRAEFTLTRSVLGASISSPGAHWEHDYDTLLRRMPIDGSVRADNVTDSI
jgi:dimethylglycine dehydrogenase